MGTALKPKAEPLSSGQSLTVVIYWKPRKNPLANGHAALIIDSQAWLNAPFVNDEDRGTQLPAYFYDRTNYVSWVGGKVDWHPPKGSKKGGAKGIANHLFEDCANWGGEQMSQTYPYNQMHWPTRWVALQGLDLQAMKDAWTAARNKESGHWRMLDKNCATMVHTILKAGGGDAYATGHKKQLVWWPSDLIRYAKSMDGHVFRKSNSPEAMFL